MYIGLPAPTNVRATVLSHYIAISYVAICGKYS